MAKKPQDRFITSADELSILGKCNECRHKFIYSDGCAVFKKIPSDILTGKVSHKKPYEGDNGIRFESRLPDIKFSAINSYVLKMLMRGLLIGGISEDIPLNNENFHFGDMEFVITSQDKETRNKLREIASNVSGLEKKK